MNIYFISYLINNLDDFVLVYNSLKKSSLLLLVLVNNNKLNKFSKYNKNEVLKKVKQKRFIPRDLKINK